MVLIWESCKAKKEWTISNFLSGQEKTLTCSSVQWENASKRKQSARRSTTGLIWFSDTSKEEKKLKRLWTVSTISLMKIPSNGTRSHHRKMFNPSNHRLSTSVRLHLRYLWNLINNDAFSTALRTSEQSVTLKLSLESTVPPKTLVRWTVNK